MLVQSQCLNYFIMIVDWLRTHRLSLVLLTLVGQMAGQMEELSLLLMEDSPMDLLLIQDHQNPNQRERNFELW